MSTEMNTTTRSTAHYEDPELDEIFKKQYQNAKRHVIAMKFNQVLVNSNYLGQSKYKIMTTSRVLKGHAESPSDTLFRTHTYEFRIILSKENENSAPPKSPISSAHLRLLRRTKSMSLEGPKYIHVEYLASDSPVISFTQVNNPKDDYLVSMTWPEGTKTNFKGKFKLELCLYAFQNLVTLERMDIVSKFLSNEFTIVSKPGVWINNQKKVTPSKTKKEMKQEKSEEDGIKPVDIATVSTPPKMQQPTQATVQNIIASTSTGVNNPDIDVSNIIAPVPVANNEFFEEEDGGNNPNFTSLPSYSAIPSFQFDATSQELVLSLVDDPNAQGVSDNFAPFGSQLHSTAPNNGSTTVLSANAALVRNEGLSQTTGSANFLHLSFGNSGIMGSFGSQDTPTRNLLLSSSQDRDTFFESHFMQ